MATEDDKEKSDALKRLQAERARRLRGNRKREREPPLHAGGFSKTAQCEKCSSYKTKTLCTDRGQSIREHICNLCGWRFKTEMLDIEPPTKRFRRGLRRKPRDYRRMLEHDGRTMSISDWANETGIGDTLIRQRLRYGWTTQATLETPVKAPHLILHDGRVQSAADWSRETGIKLRLILDRLRRGWTLQEIISTPAGVPRKKSGGDEK